MITTALLHRHLLAQLDIAPAVVAGELHVKPLRVMHGGDYICYGTSPRHKHAFALLVTGFLMGPASGALLYLSDVSAVPKVRMQLRCYGRPSYAGAGDPGHHRQPARGSAGD